MDASAQALDYARRNAASVGCDAETLQGDALTLLADLDTPLASSLLYLGGSAVLVGCLILLLEKQSERK